MSGRPRLNPLVFPSDTDFRFILLIVSVVGASLFAYHTIGNYLFRNDFVEVNLRCFIAANTVFPTDPPIDSPEAYQKQQLIQNCLQPFNLKLSAFIISGAGLMLIVALVLYWIAPTWKLWRERLTPLSAEDAPEVLAYLEQLCQEVGLHHPPTFMWNPLNPGKSGLAFGRFGRYYVALHGGLVTLFYTDRPSFRAVIFHELAHLKNADIDKTYFAVAVWQAFVAVASIPFIGLVVYVAIKNPVLDETALSLADWVWRIIPLTALVYLMRNAVLRTREIYADVRASVWDDSSGALSRVLSTLPYPKKIAQRIGLSVHPDPNERRQLLAETNRLFFRLGFWDAFATGMAVGIAVPNMVLFLSFLVPFKQAILTTIAPALLTAPLVVGILGVSVWRSTFAVLWEERNSQKLGRLGIGLGVGLILGYALSFDSSSMQSLVSKSSPLGLYAALGFMALPVSLFCFLFLRWMKASASVWLESATTRRLFSQVSVPGYVIAGVILAACLGVVFSFLELAPTISGMSDLFQALILAPLLLFMSRVPVLPLIIVYPMAAGFRRRQNRVDMQWAFLDDSSQELAPPLQTPLHPWHASITGLVGGVIFSGLLLIIRIGLRIAYAEELRNTEGFLLNLHYGSIALAALLQVGVAVIEAAWVRGLGWVHGLYAAFVSGCIMTMGILGLNLLFGGALESAFIWSAFSQVINVGLLFALPFALVASVVSGRLRRSFA